MWVRPIEWSKLNFASCVVHLYFIYDMVFVFVKLWGIEVGEEGAPWTAALAGSLAPCPTLGVQCTWYQVRHLLTSYDIEKMIHTTPEQLWQLYQQKGL